MTARCMLVMVSAIFLASGPSTGQDKKDDKENLNPYRTAKVGDFAIYKLVSQIGGKDIEGTKKEIVTGKDEKSVKLKISYSNLKENEKTIDLTKPHDILDYFKKDGGTFKKSGDGTEKIKVAGKEYNANWLAGKATNKTPSGKELTFNIKVWFSKDAPLAGLLRINIGSDTAELIEFGSAK